MRATSVLGITEQTCEYEQKQCYTEWTKCGRMHHCALQNEWLRKLGKADHNALRMYGSQRKNVTYRIRVWTSTVRHWSRKTKEVKVRFAETELFWEERNVNFSSLPNASLFKVFVMFQLYTEECVFLDLHKCTLRDGVYFCLLSTCFALIAIRSCRITSNTEKHFSVLYVITDVW